MDWPVVVGRRRVYLLCLCVSIILCAYIFVTVNADKPTKQVIVTAEDEKLRDPDGYAAIRELHSQMDDDKSGSIDRAESADFLKEDLNLAGKEQAVRENAFHHKNDDSITVDDLWESWFQSKEREWTTSEMVYWIETIVKLPNYVDNISTAKCTGISLPRMALPNSSYLTEVLKIKSYMDRQRIQLKALDMVLFGAHEPSKLKDVMLGLLAASLIALATVFVRHQKQSQKQVEDLHNQLSVLNTMENNFGDEQDEDLIQLRDRIKEMEQQLDEQSNYDPSTGLYQELQPLLRKTYEREMAYVNKKKEEYSVEMNAAKEFVNKLTRKQTGFFNSIKMVAGATPGTDNIDQKIFKLKERMERIKEEMAELYNRYVQMENILGFQIISPLEYKPEPQYRFISSNSQASSSSSYLPGMINGGI